VRFCLTQGCNTSALSAVRGNRIDHRLGDENGTLRYTYTAYVPGQWRSARSGHRRGEISRSRLADRVRHPRRRWRRRRDGAGHPILSQVPFSVINLETNAGTHDHKRALDEAADLNDFFSAPGSRPDAAAPSRAHRLRRRWTRRSRTRRASSASSGSYLQRTEECKQATWREHRQGSAWPWQ
jgi:hypothetical protein